jgi:DnaJ-class molecular chaperone
MRRYVRCPGCDGTGIDPAARITDTANDCRACDGSGGFYLTIEVGHAGIRISRDPERVRPPDTGSETRGPGD